MEANAIAGVNLNDPWVLSLYTRLVTFRGDSAQSLCTFQGLTPVQQRDLQGIAHHLGLEYEYTRADRTARIGRPSLTGQQGVIAEAVVESAPTSLKYHGRNESNGGDETQRSLHEQRLEHSNRNGRILYGSGYDMHSIHDPRDSSMMPWFSKEHTSAETRYFRPSTDSLQSIPDVSSPQGSHFATYHTSSRASSTSSLHSGHGRSRFRKMFSRRSSLHSRPSFQSQTSLQSKASSGYEEIVFEVETGRPPSLSVSSRQRASMDNVKKAAMLAVKKVGACWRCKILRKTCDPDSPCQNCPKTSHQSDWHSVGCKRGTIVDKVARTLLCPNVDKPARRSSSPERRRETKDVKRKNKEVRRVTEQRNSHVNEQPAVDIFRNWLLERSHRLDGLHSDDDVVANSTQLQPLMQCALAIEWEIRQLNVKDGLHKDAWRQFIHEIYPWFSQFELLLHSATEYQSCIEQNQLIAQSLICVRNSLEVFRAQFCATSGGDSHARCSLTSGCKVECTSELDASLHSYLKELGRVLFKKENMRSTDCWLSLFYSLCLQGYVRRLLCRISIDDTRSFPREYLHLVVRLFSARFGTYDPLAFSLSNPENSKDTSMDKNHVAAQLAVNRSTWESRSISNPCQYLKGLCGAAEVGLKSDNKTTAISERTAPDVFPITAALQDSIESIARIELTNTLAFDEEAMWFGDDTMDPLHDKTLYGNDWECDMDTFDVNRNDELMRHNISPSLPTEADLQAQDPSLKPHEYRTCSPDDIFTPQWVRGHGAQQQGWCGLCDPGQWLFLSDSSYMQDKAFNHGINPATGRRFEEPKSTRQSSCDTWEAYCGICLQWIPLYWDKDNSYFWNEHAFRCHTLPGALSGTNLGLDRAESAAQAQTANDFDFAII